MRFIRGSIRRLQRYGKRWWYIPLIAVLAFLDSFIVIVPTDSLLISAVMMRPKRWVYAFLVISLGSTLGACALASFVTTYGDSFVHELFPSIYTSSMWTWTDQLMDKYGALAIFLVSLSPATQHPAVILGGLTGVPLFEIFVAIFLGRAIKYSFFAWIASHSPKLLKKLWGVQGELKDVLNEQGKPAVEPEKKSN